MSDSDYRNLSTAPYPVSVSNVDVLHADDVYAGVLEHMLNGIAYCQMLFDDGAPCDFIYLYTNPAFHVQTGIGPVCGKRVSEVIPGIRESDPQLIATYGRVARGGKPEIFEIFVESLKQWFSVQVFSPKLDHFVAVFDVITERKKREEQLRIQELVLDQIQDHVTITNLDGVVTYVNRAQSLALNYPPNARIGRHVSDYGDGPKADATQHEVIEATLSKGAWRGRIVNYRADGSDILLDLRTTLIRDEHDRPVAMVGIGTDITERISAEQRLLAERDLTRLYLAVADVFIVVLDKDGRIQLINRKGSETLGWVAEELVGQPWSNYCVQSARRDWTAYFQKLISGEASPQELSEYMVTTREGASRLLEWRRVVLYDHQNEPYGVVSSGRDVTEERRAQLALTDHQAQLEATIEERTAELGGSEARTRAIVTTMLDGVIHLDAHGTVLSVNLAIQQMFGYLENEIVGQNIAVLMPDPPASIHDHYIERYLRTRDPHIIGRRLPTMARRKDGSLLPVELAVNEMEDETGTSVIGRYAI